MHSTFPRTPAPIPGPELTFERGGEAEGIKAVEVPVARAVAADARGEVHAAAGLAGQADGVLHRAIGQPARVAPVQPLAPRLEELVKVGEDGTLVPAHLLGFVEVEPVLPAGRLVGEHDAWRQMGRSAGSVGNPPNPSPAPAEAMGVPDPCQIQALGQAPPQRGRDKAQACRDGAAPDVQAPAASCQRHLVAQGHTGSVRGTRTPSWGQHLHIQGCTDYHGDAATTTTGLYRSGSWERTDSGQEGMDHPCGDGEIIVTKMHRLQEQGYKDQHCGDIWAMIPGHTWTTNHE